MVAYIYYERTRHYVHVYTCICLISLSTFNKVMFYSLFRRGKTYGSVRLRKKKSKGTIPIPDREIGSWM